MLLGFIRQHDSQRAEWKNFSISRFAVCAVFVLAAALSRSELPAADKDAEAIDPEAVQFFEQHVQPILKANCAKCHTDATKSKGGLRLTSRESILKGGDSGPAVDIENPDASVLLEAINYQGFEMPPSGKLPPEQIETLTRWVKMGLPWTPGAHQEEQPAAAAHGPPPVNDETKSFWSFQPVKRPDVPVVKQSEWVRSPIDAFILSKLEAAELSPAVPASKQAVLRRLYYDLIGLPPTPEEVAAFLADDSDNAYESVVDRLLDSPHYGERWARHWLDLVRYAESDSYERDNPKPNVWRYRDYVIQSLNADKPYDQFIREQLAGDEMQPMTRDSLIATGYYRLGIWDDEPSDPEQALYDDLDDIVATTSQVFLGLTMNCARCHDHKLDPIPQRDYYRMLAFFNGLNRYGIRHPDTIARFSLRSIAELEQERQQAEQVTAHKEREKENAKRIAAIEEIVKPDFSDVEKEEFKDEGRRLDLLRQRVGKLLSEQQFADYESLVNERRELKKFRPPALDMAMCVTEIGREPRPTHVLIRGNPHVPGDPVEPGFPSVLGTPDPSIAALGADAKTSGRRTALANWIASPENPLTARVLVNRIWQFHFGRGIVRSSSDFGFQGTKPTHPELLDWLASEFVTQGWKLKPLHKLIVMSNTYRMSSDANEAALAKDPENDLVWRFDMRRLTAEEIRDSILAVNGSLNLDKMYGPSVYPVIPDEVLAGQSMPGHNWGDSSFEDRTRRSIYIHIKRSLPVPLLASFDAADTDFSCPVRFATTQPTQALGMLNSEFIAEEAKRFAESLQKSAANDLAAQVQLALRRTLQRDPTEQEIARGVNLIGSLKQDFDADDSAALATFCLLALNLNEFVYLD